MRRVRSDVSHRIRRRPSIFSARWFRIALGVGLLLVLGLLVGPSVASWFGGEFPRSLSSFVPWSRSSKTVQSRPPEPVTPRLSTPSSPPPAASAPSPARGTAGTSAPPAPGSAETPSTTPGRVGVARSATAATPPAPASAGTAPPASTAPAASSPAPASPAPKPAPPRAVDAAPASGALAPPPAVYWVQVGAFLDHKNADRLVEKLKGDGLAAATTSFEQSRVLYRVLLVSGDGGRVSDDAIERVKGLGHPVEATSDGPAVTGLVPLRKAVETSHSLRQQGVPVRLKQEVSSSTFRVVRVGSFATPGEADAALAQLTAKGVEGVVVREQH